MAYSNEAFSLGSFTTTPVLTTDWFSDPQTTESNVLYLLTGGTNLKTSYTDIGNTITLFDNGIFKADFVATTYPNAFAINFYYMNEIVSGHSAGGWTYFDYIGYGIIVDEDNELAIIIACTHDGTNYPFLYRVNPMTGNTENNHKLYLAFKSIITYSWHSVGSMSGKLGTFNLSTIKDTDINNGDPVSNATSSAFNVLQQATKLSVLAENKSELTPVIYTDDINYLSLKDLTNNKCELKFYLHNRSFLKITNVSTNAFLSILIDEENKIAKPSIIYKNGSSYSYNQEEPSADTMKHLYEWLMVNEQNIKKKTGLWKTSFNFEKLED